MTSCVIYNRLQNSFFVYLLYKRPHIHVRTHKKLAEDSTTLSAKEGGSNSKLVKTLVMEEFVALIRADEYRPIKYTRIIRTEHDARNGEKINFYRVSDGKT